MKKTELYKKAVSDITRAGELKINGIITSREALQLMTEAVEKFTYDAARADYTSDYMTDTDRLYRRMAAEIKHCIK